MNLDEVMRAVWEHADAASDMDANTPFRSDAYHATKEKVRAAIEAHAHAAVEAKIREIRKLAADGIYLDDTGRLEALRRICAAVGVFV